MTANKPDYAQLLKQRNRRRTMQAVAFAVVGSALVLGMAKIGQNKTDRTNADVQRIKADLTKRLLNNDPAVVNLRAMQAPGPFPYVKVTCLQRTDTGEIQCPNVALNFSPK